MERTTLAYLRRQDMYLMMQRGKKSNDANSGKWIGVGGHFEGRESPEECVRREILEETGLVAGSLIYCGRVFFDSDSYPPEEMYLFVCDDFTGQLTEDCDEGHLEWIHHDLLAELPMWEGDAVFFDLIRQGKTGFYLHLKYSGSKLVSYMVQDEAVI